MGTIVTKYHKIEKITTTGNKVIYKSNQKSSDKALADFQKLIFVFTLDWEKTK